MKITCRLRKLKLKCLGAHFCCLGIWQRLWLEDVPAAPLLPRATVAGLLEAGRLRHFGWEEVPAAPPSSPWHGGWDFGCKLAARGKLAEILAGICLAGQNSDFPRKSEFRPKPPRTTNFHLKDPGIDQLESLTLVTMVMVSCKFDIVRPFQILASKSHFVHFWSNLFDWIENGVHLDWI